MLHDVIWSAAMVAVILGGTLIAILSSPANQRAMAVWLVARAHAQEERRNAYRRIEARRREHEDDMRYSQNLSRVYAKVVTPETQEVVEFNG